jgi:hypothetical protein
VTAPIFGKWLFSKRNIDLNSEITSAGCPVGYLPMLIQNEREKKNNYITGQSVQYKSN